jgi:hypothetical protein
MSYSSPLDNLPSSDMGLIRSLFLVTIALVLLYVPLGFAIILHPIAKVSVDVFNVLILTAFTNHCINWIIYGALSKNFRRGYKSLCLGLARFCIFSDKTHADNILLVSEHTRTSRKTSNSSACTRTSRKSSKDNSSGRRKTSRKSSKDEQPTGRKRSFEVAVETRTYLVDPIEEMTSSV